eukprot:Gb_20131 [translate_table: standard]
MHQILHIVWSGLDAHRHLRYCIANPSLGFFVLIRYTLRGVFLVVVPSQGTKIPQDLAGAGVIIGRAAQKKLLALEGLNNSIWVLAICWDAASHSQLGRSKSGGGCQCHPGYPWLTTTDFLLQLVQESEDSMDLDALKAGLNRPVFHPELQCEENTFIFLGNREGSREISMEKQCVYALELDQFM